MSQTPFSRVTYTSRRQNKVLFAFVVLAMLLAAGLYWGTQRIIDQERGRFTIDFLTLVGYAHEQETFLHELRHQSGQLSDLPDARLGSIHEVATVPDVGDRLFEGRESVVGMPFSLLCKKSCPIRPETLMPLGSYLAEFYSSFWAASYFPAATVFFINEEHDASISVPAVNVSAGYEPIDLETYRAVVDAVRERLSSSVPTKDCQWQPGDKPVADETIWFRAAALPDQLIGWIPSGFSPGIWSRLSSGPASCIYGVILLSRSRVGVLERAVNPAPRHTFWLQRHDQTWLNHNEHGLLIGEGQPPGVKQPGLHYTPSGLVFKVVDSTGNWAGYYFVSYVSFFQDNLWLPVSVLLVLLIGITSGLLYLRWYNRQVILPAQEAQHEILESDAFNRTLIQTAPVALCLIDRDDGHLVFGNGLALDWLGATVGERLPDSAAATRLLDQVLSAPAAGVIEQLDMAGRTLYVAYAPTRYRQRDVILCAFADVSARAEIERQLALAKAAADDASVAKSTFLATMSHEIRTPLYGALGTLELLATTRLDRQQRQYVERIDDASQMLLQLISDILDVSKIEAGQLRLEKRAFQPRELVQSCTGTYAAMAHRKGLLLFSVVDPEVPLVAIGDAVRIRQILSNLISNAIKFTEFGHVIVRLSQVDAGREQTRLHLEVCDSGVGISKAHQAKLFTPFFLIDGGHRSLGGAGLGLSICERLADLMGAEITLESKPQQGSRFAVTLDLAVGETPDDHEPQLAGASVLVRSPHPELTDNICTWLRYWGAQAAPARDRLLPGNNDEAILLDVQRSSPGEVLEWHGPILAVYLSGEVANGAVVDAYSLSSIGYGIGQLLNGKRPSEQQEMALPQFHFRVLVAEDHPLNQVTLQGQLELLGCEVQLAGDGEEALAQWDITPYDLVLTDVNMPYLNGYDLARKLRAEGATVPIIGVTANAMLDEERRCVEAGMNDWLVKPIEVSTLVEILRKYSHSNHNQLESQDDRDFKHVEPNVLNKHRDIFLSTMEEDMRQLEQGMADSDADRVATALHRMRAALALANHRALAAQMAELELHMQTQGLDEQGQARMSAIVTDIRRVLNNIASI